MKLLAGIAAVIAIVLLIIGSYELNEKMGCNDKRDHYDFSDKRNWRCDSSTGWFK